MLFLESMSKNSEIEVGLAQLQVVQPFYSFLSSHLEDCVSKNFDDSTKLTLVDAVRRAKRGQDGQDG